MLRILGSFNPFRRGLDRREAMRIGGLGVLGLGLPELSFLDSLQAAENPAHSTFGRAKRI